MIVIMQTPDDAIMIFLCGDVMTGRGIDQILRHPSDPQLYEEFVTSAVGYVQLAESAHGPIPRRVDDLYIWGDALPVLEECKPHVRIINLETSVTTSEKWLEKGINYRMNPENVGCLTAARIDCCALANNHILDWGKAGLLETVEVLRAAGIKTAGAGRNREEAQAPAILEIPNRGRVLVFSFGMEDSGVPAGWAATNHRAGVDYLGSLSARAIREIQAQITRAKKPGDVVVASIHWGSNWGYEISPAHRSFARALIDVAGVDLIHGHSSHHPRALEIHRNKLILYGCGDFINDYEGIGGFESYRGDLALMYCATIQVSNGELLSLRTIALQRKGFRLQYASEADAHWLREVLFAQP
jgi:poly-gamma-glutamate synthesis protein (capsule biosynthesis protein)